LQPLNDVFYCQNETSFYEQALIEMILYHRCKCKNIIEFGSGKAVAMIHALKTTAAQDIKVFGYEIHQKSHEQAQINIQHHHLQNMYQVIHQSFFKQTFLQKEAILVANPPYIPYASNDIALPHLWGGKTGCELSLQLIDFDFDSMMLIVSSYSNPQKLLDYAHKKGYKVQYFKILSLPFGSYSKEQKVQAYLQKLKEEKKAFFENGWYKIAALFFTKKSEKKDLSKQVFDYLTLLNFTP
jgi:methylase of polypeptide subunit release factors